MPDLKDMLATSIAINTSGSLSDPNMPSSRDSGGIEPAVLTPRMIRDAKESGITSVIMTIGYIFGNGDPYEFTKKDIQQWDECLSKNSADILKVLSATDIEQAKSDGRIGLVYAFQNAEAFGTRPERVAEFASLGVRVMQMTYNGQNLLGGGSLVNDSIGLTALGHEMINAIQSSRAIVDLSHSNQQTCLDAIQAATQPIAITHTGCRALVDIPRNKTDRELRLVGESGGYVGIYFMPFLASGRNATCDDLVAHITHAINVCGEDCIGIGTDTSFTPIDDMARFKQDYTRTILERRALGVSAPGEEPDIYPFVEDLQGTGQLHGLIAGLERHGYRSGTIEKILGANFLKFARNIWGS